jgi:hypothetical protein
MPQQIDNTIDSCGSSPWPPPPVSVPFYSGRQLIAVSYLIQGEVGPAVASEFQQAVPWFFLLWQTVSAAVPKKTTVNWPKGRIRKQLTIFPAPALSI